MGATNCPETPRQRMIGMMYLVLTAMLALNVSKDILNAFVVVNDAMEQTAHNFGSKLYQSYDAFNKAEEAEPGKVKEYNDKAKQIKKISEELVAYFEDVKREMFIKVDGIKKAEDVLNKRLPDMAAKDNYDKPTTYFIVPPPTGNGKAYEMREKIEQYKENVIKIVNDTNFVIPVGLETEATYKDNDG